MSSSSQEIIVTLITGSVLLLFLVGVIIIAATRYQNRKREHLMEMERMQHAAAQQLLEARLEVQEKTLTNVSREIHDNIGQVLSLVKLNMNKLMGESQLPSPVLTSTKELVAKAIQDLRALSKTLNSGYLSGTPLCESLKFDLSLVNQSGSFQTNLHVSGSEPDLDPQKKIIVYRMAQELLNNAIKHSKANLIEIFLSFSEDNLTMRVEDNGTGFTAPNATDKISSGKNKGTGLGNLALRAKMIGADFTIESGENKGTKAVLQLPL
jgi:two-component system, NarL family, sensor kinase